MFGSKEIAGGGIIFGTTAIVRNLDELKELCEEQSCVSRDK